MNITAPKPILNSLPISHATKINIDSVFNYSNFAVSVNYYVLRSQKKNYS